MARLAHYAESFCLTTGQCFRMIQAEDGTGHAQHCPYLPEWRGRFQDRAGKWHTVESAMDTGPTWTQSSESLPLRTGSPERPVIARSGRR